MMGCILETLHKMSQGPARGILEGGTETFSVYLDRAAVSGEQIKCEDVGLKVS